MPISEFSMSEVLDKLRALKQSGNYLFHGSGAVIEKFEPRQAHTYRDGKHIPDGLPAIFASPILDCAIFRALFSKANFPHGSHSAWSWDKSGVIAFKATKKSLAELRDDMQGYIYIRPRRLRGKEYDGLGLPRADRTGDGFHCNPYGLHVAYSGNGG